MYIENQNNRAVIKPQLDNSNTDLITPIRLQAYERVVLFLERINPSSMVMKANKNGNSAALQAELLKVIRTEFEHNLSQQIYMSNKAWENVVKGKEETIKLINVAASTIKPDAPGMEMAQSIINVTAHLSSLPTKDAIKYLKKEIGKEF